MNDKQFTAEHISTFSIVEKEGKKFLHIILKEGEKIDIQISTHVQELHDILDSSPQKLRDMVVEVMKWANEEYKIFNKHYAIWDKERDIAFDKRLDLPENTEAKNLFSLKEDSLDPWGWLEIVCKQSDIKGKFSYEKERPSLPYLTNDAFVLLDMQKLFKIIDAKIQGLFLPVSKMLGVSSHESESQYGAQDVISKEWIRDHLVTIEKLFMAFEKSSFSGQNPVPFSQRHEDEKNLLLNELKHVDFEEENNSDQKKDESENETIKQFDTSHDSLKVLGLEDELEKLFGEDNNRKRRYYYSRFYQGDNIPEEMTKIILVSREIYKKLRLLGLYYQGELKIKTKDGLQTFTDKEMSKLSVDGKLYYKDHEEKYGGGDDGEDRGTFFSDLHKGIEKDVFLPFTNLKITDLTYGALKDVFALLGESGLAPAFCMILLTSMLPGLKVSYKENASLNNFLPSIE